MILANDGTLKQEICDDGNIVSWDGCSKDCLSTGDQGPDITAPSIPGNPTISFDENTSRLNFSWTESSDLESGVSFYLIKMGRTTGSSCYPRYYGPDITAISNSASYQLQPDDYLYRYCFQIRAIDMRGNTSGSINSNYYFVNVPVPIELKLNPDNIQEKPCSQIGLVPLVEGSFVYLASSNNFLKKYYELPCGGKTYCIKTKDESNFNYDETIGTLNASCLVSINNLDVRLKNNFRGYRMEMEPTCANNQLAIHGIKEVYSDPNLKESTINDISRTASCQIDSQNFTIPCSVICNSGTKILAEVNYLNGVVASNQCLTKTYQSLLKRNSSACTCEDSSDIVNKACK